MFHFKTNNRKKTAQIIVIKTCSCYLSYLSPINVNSIFINGIMDVDLHCSKIHLRHGRTSVDVSWTLSAVLCVTRRSRGRNYEAELQSCQPEAILVEFGEYHPLKPIMVSCLSFSWSSDLNVNIPTILSTRAFPSHATLQIGLPPLNVWCFFSTVFRWLIQKLAMGPATEVHPLPLLHPLCPQIH